MQLVPVEVEDIRRSIYDLEVTDEESDDINPIERKKYLRTFKDVQHDILSKDVFRLGEAENSDYQCWKDT